MAENNFFNLNLSHKVVKDFNDDHRKSVKLFKDSYSYLDQLDEELKPNETIYEKSMEFYRMINHTHAAMNETFTNLFISYYAFRKTAEQDGEVMKEFKKLPADFSPVQKQFTDMLHGYKIVLERFKKAV